MSMVRECTRDIEMLENCAWALLLQPEDAQMKKVYQSRFIVPGTKDHIPLCESILRLGSESTKLRASSARCAAMKAKRYYDQAGFNYEAIRNMPGIHGMIPADHLAVELLFVAHALKHELRARDVGEEESARVWRGLAERFTREHARGGVECACLRMESTEGDVYCKVMESARRELALISEVKALE